MSRLRYAFHMRFADIKAFRDAITRTPQADLNTWELPCKDNRISTEGVLFWFWLLWSYQLEEIGRNNFLFMEWRFRTAKFLWPYGTLEIPLAVLGKTELARNILNLNYKNATT